MKICSKCKEEKELSKFYKDISKKGGYDCLCKNCKKIIQKKYDQSEKGKNAKKKYMQSAKGKKTRKKTDNNYIKNNPEKIKAHNLLNSALKSGKITKENCWFCNTDQNIEGHHFDYTKPLEVLWCCRKHHNHLHKNLNYIKKQLKIL